MGLGDNCPAQDSWGKQGEDPAATFQRLWNEMPVPWGLRGGGGQGPNDRLRAQDRSGPHGAHRPLSNGGC